MLVDSIGANMPKKFATNSINKMDYVVPKEIDIKEVPTQKRTEELIRLGTDNRGDKKIIIEKVMNQESIGMAKRWKTAWH